MCSFGRVYLSYLFICFLIRKFNLPIIADEIYGGCVFDGVFTSVSSVSGDVPVILVGGKRTCHKDS